MKAPDGIDDRALVLMADIFPTGTRLPGLDRFALTRRRLFRGVQRLQRDEQGADCSSNRRRDRLRSGGAVRDHQRRRLPAKAPVGRRLGPLQTGSRKISGGRAMELPDGSRGPRQKDQGANGWPWCGRGHRSCWTEPGTPDEF